MLSTFNPFLFAQTDEKALGIAQVKIMNCISAPKKAVLYTYVGLIMTFTGYLRVGLIMIKISIAN